MRFEIAPVHARISDWRKEKVVPANRALLDKCDIGASMATMLPDADPADGLLFVSRITQQQVFDDPELHVFQALSRHSRGRPVCGASC